MALNDFAVNRTDFVGEDRDLVAHDEIANRDVFEDAPLSSMREGGDSFGQRAQHGRRLGHGKRLQRFAAGEHQHHDRTREVLVEQRGCHNRDARQMIGTELAMRAFPQQAQH